MVSDDPLGDDFAATELAGEPTFDFDQDPPQSAVDSASEPPLAAPAPPLMVAPAPRPPNPDPSAVLGEGADALTDLSGPPAELAAARPSSIEPPRPRPREPVPVRPLARPAPSASSDLGLWVALGVVVLLVVVLAVALAVGMLGVL